MLFIQRSILVRPILSCRKCCFHNTSNTLLERVAKIDKSEDLTFTALSDRWWDKDGDFRLLHAMNSLRIEFINLIFQNTSSRPWFPLLGKRIMDVGCGGGILSEPLSRLGAKVLGIDVLPEGIDAAREHLARVNPELWDVLPFGAPEYRNISTAEAAAQFPGEFDAVIVSEVLEHVSDWEQLVNDVSHCLKPGGNFIATTVNQTWLSYWFGIIVAERIFRLTPAGMHTWDKFIEPSKLNIVSIRHGLQPRKVLGMLYCPLSNKWSWTKSQAISYAFHAIKVEPESR